MIRRLISADEKERIEKRNKLIIVIILGTIMLISSASYAFMSFEGENSGVTVEKISVNGVELSKTEYGTWKFTTQGRDFETRYNPQETTNVSIVLTKSLQNYANLPLYLGIDSREDLATSGNTEIISNIGTLLMKYQESCLTKNCTENLPIKNCSENNVIIFKEINETKTSQIKENANCVYIDYKNQEELMAADAFIFKILGLR